MSPQTLDNKCHELAQRLAWPAKAITWKADTDPAGRPFGITLRLARGISMAALTPHLQVSFPGVGQMISSKPQEGGRGRKIRIPTLTVDANADAEENQESSAPAP